MNLSQAKSTLLVRCIELADPAGVLLPLAVRERCTTEAQPSRVAEAGDSRDGGPLPPTAQAFLARRAGLVLAELRQRSPALAELGAATGLSAVVIGGGAFAILAIGFFSRHVWSDRPLHLLNFPLLWLIAWNLLVYVWLLAGPLLRTDAGRSPNPLVGLVAAGLARLRWPRVLESARSGDDRAAVTVEAGARFAREWVPLQTGIVLAQARTLLHAGALILTVGTAAGLLVRGFFHEYLAGWEATWQSFDAEELHGFLSLFLRPASWLTGIAIPSVDEIAALRFVNGTGGGNAQDWILLYVAAAFVYVVVPRAGLWLLGVRQAATRRREFYFPAADDRYYRRLLQAGRGADEVAAVFWHGVEPTAGLRARVREALADELGARVTLEFLEPVAYGEESAALQRLAVHDPREHLVAVFSLAATPEEEVQGELLRALAAAAATAEAPPLLVLLDAAPLGRFAAAAGYRTHYEERQRTWQRFIRDHHATLRLLEPPAAAASPGPGT